MSAIVAAKVLSRVSDKVPEGEKVYTRAEFAKRVGVSTWTLLRYHREGHFLAFACDSKGGRGRDALYVESQVETFRSLVPREDPVANTIIYTVEEAQKVFRALDEGKSLRHCVADLGVHPLAVEILAEKYARLDQGVFIPRQKLEEIDSLGLDGPSPLRTAEELAGVILSSARAIEALEERVATIEKPPCEAPSCKRTAAFCGHCVRDSIGEAEEAARKAGYDEGYKAAIAEIRAQVDAQKTTGPTAEAVDPAKTPPSNGAAKKPRRARRSPSPPAP
jgi:hypothetical protein